MKFLNKIIGKNNKTLLIDLVFATITFVFLTLEFAGKIYIDANTTVVVDIILILLPSIVTIVSIVLSLTKEKIFGITLSEFNRIRGAFFYSFLHMVIVMISVFAVYTFSLGFRLGASIYLIDSISLFYAFYFSIQEIPVLMHNKKIIGKIIKNKYKHRNREDVLGTQADTKLLNTVLKNIIFEEGLRTAYDTFWEEFDNKYNEELLHYLLDLQNNYLWNVIEDIEFIKANINGDYEGIEIVKAIDIGFLNVEELISFKNGFDYKTIISSSDDTYQLTRSLFSLFKICKLVNLESKSNNKLNSIANRMLLQTFSNDPEKPYSFMTLMAISTLSSGETWFIKALRDSDYSTATLLSIDCQPIGLFLSILISYLIKIFPKQNGELENFINEPVGGINGDDLSWKKHIIRFVESAGYKQIIDLLPKLIQIYKSINSSYFENIHIKRNGVIHDYYGFDITYLYNAWIEMLLFSNNYFVNVDDVRNVLNNLSEEDKEKLAYYLPNKWIKSGALNKDVELEFISIFSDDKIEVEENLINKKIIDVFVEFHKIHFKKDLDKKASQCNPDYSEIREKLIQPFSKIKESKFYNKDISLIDVKPQVYYFRIEGFDTSGLVDAYSKSIYNSLCCLIKDSTALSASTENILEFTDRSFSSELLTKIEEMEPEIISSNSCLDHRINIETQFPNAILVDDDFLINNFFGKKNSFSFNIELVESETTVRKLTNSEIEKIIEQEYTPINGFYKFSDYKEDNIRSILITKEELSTYLRARIQFVQLVFKKKVSLINNQYLIVKKK